MIDRIDQKGKIFTERIRKDHVEVEIVTIQGRVHGYVHLTPTQRVKDLLNTHNEQFLAVTSATLGDADNPDAPRYEFITINKHYIVTVIPINEPRLPQPNDDYPPY